MHPLLGRASVDVPLRMGGSTGRIGMFGLTRRGTDGAFVMHKGVDWLCPKGWPVFAAHRGTIQFAGEAKGYGKVIYLGKDDLETRYAHLSEIIAIGDVEAGQLIGRTGTSGNAKGLRPHLHFEVRIDGDPTDPLEWLNGNGNTPNIQ